MRVRGPWSRGTTADADGPARSASLTVRVEPPRVRGGRVWFRWQQDPANRLQRRDAWFVDYHGVPVDRMDRRLLYDVLLSLQLPLWAAQAARVTVVLPEPFGDVSRDFWRAYFDAEHVEIRAPRDPGPGRQGSGAAPYRLPRRVEERRVAVTFGGGKDSTLAQQALLEGRDPRDVLLLHVVQLHHNRWNDQRRAARRSARTIVEPNQRLQRTPVQMVTTDFLAVLRHNRPGPRPHVNLYVPAMLPALVHHGVRQVVFSRTAAGYRIRRGADGVPRFANPTGRPERLRVLEAYCGQVLGWPVHAESTHAALGEYVSYGALLAEYPAAFRQVVMCTSSLGRGRFCHGCAKCLEYALLGLSLGHVAADVDYDRLLRTPRVEGLVARARAVQAPAWHGAGPFHRDLGTRSHFATWCHALHTLDPGSADLRVTPAARENLRVLREGWGQVAFPAVTRIDARAVRFAGPLGREVAEVAARSFPVVEPACPPRREDLLLVGDRAAEFDYDVAMPTPLLDAWAARWEVPVPPVQAGPVPPQRRYAAPAPRHRSGQA